MTPAGAGSGPAGGDPDPARRVMPPQAARATLIGGVVLAVLLSLVAMNHATSRDAARLYGMQRPAGVPADAVLCAGKGGGVYVSLRRQDLVLADGRRLPAFKIGAWNSRDGQAAFLGTGIFVPDPEAAADAPARSSRAVMRTPSEAEILRRASFDGRELRFDLLGTQASGRIIPLDMLSTGE